MANNTVCVSVCVYAGEDKNKVRLKVQITSHNCVMCKGHEG